MRSKFYLDPLAATSGDGSLTSPFRLWSEFPWQPGADFLIKRGTALFGELQPRASGFVGAKLSIGAYGVGPRPILDGTGSNRGSLFLNKLSNIDISGLELTGSDGGSSASINLLDSYNISIDDCYAHHSRQGFRIDNSTNTDKSGFRITNSEVSDTTNVGLAVVCGTLRGGTLHDVFVDNVELRRVATTAGNAGINIGSRLTSTQPYDPDFVPYDIWLSRILLDETGPGYGIIMKYVTRGGVKGSEITRVGLQNTAETHTVWIGGGRYIEIEGNEIHNNGCWEGGTHGAGAGVFIDQGAISGTAGDHGSRHCKVVGNHIHDQSFAPSEADTPSAAVSVYRSTETLVSGNVIHNCRHGISAQGAGTLNTERSLVVNNTLVDIERSAITVRDRADNTIVVNNVIERAGVGIFEESGSAAIGHITRDWNCVHASTRHNFAKGSFNAFKNGNETPLPPNAHDIEEDPLLGPTFDIGPDSPCFGTARTVELARDINANPLRDPPDMGAKQAFTEVI